LPNGANASRSSSTRQSRVGSAAPEHARGRPLEEKRLQRRRPGRADLTVVSAIVIAATLSLTHPALSQDAKSDLDAYMKRNEAERAQYLQEHPVRPSTLFDSVSSLVGTLGEFDVIALDACEYDPLLPEWRDAVGGLRENTIVALAESHLNAEKRRIAAMPADQTVVDRSLCAEAKRRHAEIVRQLKSLVPALRKRGY
jgi:hypothetical protein